MYETYKFLRDAVDSVGMVAELRYKGTMYPLYDQSRFDDDFFPYPARKLNNAKKSFGKNIDDSEKILLLFDTTLFGSATDGIIFTDKKIYIKNLFEDPCEVAYEDIDEIKVHNKDSTLELYNKNGDSFGIAYKIKPIAGHDFFLSLNLAHFIVGFSAIINANKQLINEKKPLLDNKDAQNLYDECFLYKFHFEGDVPEESAVEKFLNKHEDSIAKVLESSGVSDFVYQLQTGEDEAWLKLVEKLYQVLPMPVRMVIPERKVKELILNNKDAILRRIREWGVDNV